jgi:hypothetical protein
MAVSITRVTSGESRIKPWVVWTGLFSVIIITLFFAVYFSEKRQKSTKPGVSPMVFPGAMVSEAIRDPDRLIAAYGTPSEEIDTSYDHPRPVIVTRVLTFKEINTRIAYGADESIRSGPPYTKWTLIGCIDTVLNIALPCREAAVKMGLK